MYVDESGFDRHYFRLFCRAKVGVKVKEKVSGKRYKRTSIVAGQVNGKIIAPLQYDGTMNYTLFEWWVENMLIKELPENSTIIMDNATFHRKNTLPALAERYGHTVIFLPPYSPELNPIENFWAWLKKKLRKILPTFNGSFDEALTDCFIVA